MFPVAAPRLPVNRRRLGWVALACSAAGLAMGLSACGGGSRSNFFAPGSVVSFGDENSAIASFSSANLLNSAGAGNVASIQGLTYTVNPVTVDTTGVVCTQQTPPALCPSASGTFGTAVPANTKYYAFDSSYATKLELDSSSPVMQRTTTTLYNCASSSIWVQIVARAYGRGYNSQCASDTRGGAVSYATLGAKTADVIAQIAAHRGELNGSTLVTVMVGQNDILEQFDAVRSGTAEATAIATLQARADSMAAAVKDTIGTGAKVVLSLTPSLNDSPKGVANATDAALLSRLLIAYNDRLYVRGLGNVSGRDLVGVNPDTFTNSSTRSTSYVHGTALCDTSALTKPDGTTTSGLASDVLFCTTANIVSGGSTSTYIWADATHFATLGHSLVGALAYNRARQQF